MDGSPARIDMSAISDLQATHLSAVIVSSNSERMRADDQGRLTNLQGNQVQETGGHRWMNPRDGIMGHDASRNRKRPGNGPLQKIKQKLILICGLRNH